MLQGRGIFDDVLLDVPLKPIYAAMEKGRLVLQAHTTARFSGPPYIIRLEDPPGNDSAGHLDDKDPVKPFKVPFESARVLPVNINVDPVTEIPLSVGFVLRPSDKRLRMRIPIKVLDTEHCPGLKTRGYLNYEHRVIDVNVAPGVRPPEKAELSVAGLKLRDRVTFKSLQFPGKDNGCSTVLPEDTVAVIISKV